MLRYRYNAYGKVIESRDPAGLVTRYEYAAPLHLLTRKPLPDGLVEQYDYDALGRLIAINDGQTPLVWEYDIADRLVAEHQGWSTQRHTYHLQSGLLVFSHCKGASGGYSEWAIPAGAPKN